LEKQLFLLSLNYKANVPKLMGSLAPKRYVVFLWLSDHITYEIDLVELFKTPSSLADQSHESFLS